MILATIVAPSYVLFLGNIKDIVYDALKWVFEDLILGQLGEKVVKPILGYLLEKLIAPVLEALFEPIYKLIIYAPAPETGQSVFGTPTNSPWVTLFGEMWTWMVPLGLAVLVVSYLASESLSGLGFGNEPNARQREFGVVVGVLAIPLSRYVLTLYLQFMRVLTNLLAPAGDSFPITELTRYDPTKSIMALGFLFTLSFVVFLVVVLVQILRITAVLFLAGATPLLLGFALGQFPVVGEYSRKLLRMVPVLGVLPVLTALGLRLNVALFRTEGTGGVVNIDGLGIAGTLVEPLFLLTPALLGIALPITMMKSLQGMPSVSPHGAHYATGNAATKKTKQKAGQAARQGIGKGVGGAKKAGAATVEAIDDRVGDMKGIKHAKQAKGAYDQTKTRIRQNTRFGRSVTPSGALPESETGQQEIARTAAAIREDTGTELSQARTEEELRTRLEENDWEETTEAVTELAEAATQEGLSEAKQERAAKAAAEITDETATSWSVPKTERELADRLAAGQGLAEAKRNTRQKARAARLAGLSEDEQQQAAEAATEITEETGAPWSVSKTERELEARLEDGQELESAVGATRQKAKAASQGSERRGTLSEDLQEQAAEVAADITERTGPPWAVSRTTKELETRLEAGQELEAAVKHTQRKAVAAKRGHDPDFPSPSLGGGGGEGVSSDGGVDSAGVNAGATGGSAEDAVVETMDTERASQGHISDQVREALAGDGDAAGGSVRGSSGATLSSSVEWQSVPPAESSSAQVGEKGGDTGGSGSTSFSAAFTGDEGGSRFSDGFADDGDGVAVEEVFDEFDGGADERAGAGAGGGIDDEDPVADIFDTVDEEDFAGISARSGEDGQTTKSDESNEAR